MTKTPRDPRPESTLALMRDPYRFIARHCRRLQSDLFQTRLLLQRSICMTGPAAAELFYRPEHFVRRGAAPGRLQKTLFGEGGVQGLDDAPHQHRKQLFLALVTSDQVEQLGQITTTVWETAAQRWRTKAEIVLYDELQELLMRAVCAWAGVPLAEARVRRRSREVTALFDAAGAIGPRHWWARLARKRTEVWMARIIDEIRAGRIHPPEHSAAARIASFRELNGELLSRRVAAVELLNVIRPTVAVSVYITWVAHALHQYPECRRQLVTEEEGYPELFVQEVRRFYPFFPAVTARVRHAFQWQGCPFPTGRRVILDLYGTNHDPRTWEAPEEFRPERFRTWDGSPFNFIPQGGGDADGNHRCPGEGIAIELMKVGLDFLGRRMAYEVPAQDLRIDYARLPALPRSRFLIRNVRLTP